LLGLAVVWAVAWIPLGMLGMAMEAASFGVPIRLASLVRAIPLLAGIGAFCGFAFGLVLAAMERRRSFDSLSLPRVALWGLAGGLVIPGVSFASNLGWVTLADMAPALLVFGVLGAVSSVGTLIVARRAQRAIVGR
jgi:hypothetical protein